MTEKYLNKLHPREIKNMSLWKIDKNPTAIFYAALCNVPISNYDFCL